jgi:hypothetical protein
MNCYDLISGTLAGIALRVAKLYFMVYKANGAEGSLNGKVS